MQNSSIDSQNDVDAPTSGFLLADNDRLHAHIIKPKTFRGLGLDFIGMIHPPSSNGNWFVLFADDYFSK
jgi:hypothetical protein